MDPDKAYPLLLKKYSFDYISMKNNSGQIDNYFVNHESFNYHSYNYRYNNNNNNSSVSENKVLRLVGEFANLQNSLPIEFTNSIFVRVDKDNMDYMKAIIFGSEGTPYSSGAFLFDIHFGNNYPNSPPSVAITSTGNGSVRFNPNLYSTGKVCLSLLGTWSGSQGENWDPKISTVYQVLLSIQSIIMSDLVYFNEPGHEDQLGTPEGNQLNEGYSNIVRYNNIRVCMIDMIKKPPKGFEEVIKIHFYLKKEKILKEVDTWIEKAKKVPYKFDGLSSGHNSFYASRFTNKNNYLNDLIKIREELKNTLYSIKLDASLLTQKIVEKKISNDIKKNENNKILEDIEFENIDNIDMTYDSKKKDISQMNEDIAKDRYSRYIGAMGMDAVQQQSNSNIFISGAGALGIEIAKNIVLSGCKELVLHDTKNTSLYDLFGQFFLTEKDIGYNRAERSIQKLQELNYYVKITLNKDNIFKNDLNEKTIEKLGFKKFNVIILTECNNDTILIFDKFCRKNNIYLIVCDVYGCAGRIINDFGNNFQIKDKDGESIKECYIKNIKIEKDKKSEENEIIVTVIDKAKHGFQDGDLIEFNDFMDDNYKILNQKHFQIKVLSPSEFKLVDKSDICNNLPNLL
jgi:ubiquitin-protein ligase/molybdopterin/thiamine biosynthesis adenylyltransferase